MAEQTVKTTIEIDADLFYLAKMKGIQEKKSLKTIVNEALVKELSPKLKKNQRKTKKVKLPFGGYNLGGITGTFRREEIYEDF